MPEQQLNVPVPDPTTLTTEALRRETAGLKELLLTRIEAVEKANQVFTEGIQRVPTILDREIGKITALFQEKFTGIGNQIAERDVRTTSDKQAASVSVAAALQAQKEMAAAQNESNAIAVKKSDDATTKLIDSILLSIAAKGRADDDKIAAINSRLDRTEAASAGQHAARTDNRLDLGAIVGVVGGIVGIVGLGLTVAVSLFNASGHPSGINVQPPATVQTR